MNTIFYFIQNHAINYTAILSDIAPFVSFLILLSVCLFQAKITVKNNVSEPEKATEPQPEKQPIVKNPDSSQTNKKIIEKLKELAGVVFAENTNIFESKNRWTVAELSNFPVCPKNFESVEQMQNIEINNFSMSINLEHIFTVLYRFTKIEKTDKIYFDLPEKEIENTFGLEKFVNTEKMCFNECEKHIFVDTQKGYMVATDKHSIKIKPIEKTEKEPYFIDVKGFKVETFGNYPNYLGILPQKGIKLHLPKEVFSSVKNTKNFIQVAITPDTITTEIIDLNDESKTRKIFDVKNEISANLCFKYNQIKKIQAEKLTDFYLSENGMLTAISDSIYIFTTKNEKYHFSVSGTEENINYNTEENNGKKVIKIRTIKNDYSSMQQAEKTEKLIKIA